MDGGNISANYLISMKLADYENRHMGRRPARIFMSDSMFLEMTRDVKCNYQARADGENRLFGIPLSIFKGDGEKMYLSDEEE